MFESTSIHPQVVKESDSRRTTRGCYLRCYLTSCCLCCCQHSSHSRPQSSHDSSWYSSEVALAGGHQIDSNQSIVARSIWCEASPPHTLLQLPCPNLYLQRMDDSLSLLHQWILRLVCGWDFCLKAIIILKRYKAYWDKQWLGLVWYARR